MSEGTSDDGCLGCLSALGGVLALAVLISFLQWLWGVLVAVAIWLWLAPGRLVAWILTWPLFTGHLLLGLLVAAASGMALWLLAELVLRLMWPRLFLHAAARASVALGGVPLRRGEEVMQLDSVDACDHATSSASVKVLRCKPIQAGQPDRGISLAFDLGGHPGAPTSGPALPASAHAAATHQDISGVAAAPWP